MNDYQRRALEHQAQATKLLVNYFQAIAQKAGMPWDADYTAEIDQAVEHIVLAAVSLSQEALVQSNRDCQFEQQNPHEWLCTTHQILMIGSKQEPVFCSKGGPFAVGVRGGV